MRKSRLCLDYEHQGTITSLTEQIIAPPHAEGGRDGVIYSSETGRSTSTDAEPTSLPGEEGTPPEVMVVIKGATEGEAMQEHETVVERAPASTTPRKTSAQKKAAARTSTVTKQSAHRSQRSRKPSSDAGHKE